MSAPSEGEDTKYHVPSTPMDTKPDQAQPFLKLFSTGPGVVTSSGSEDGEKDSGHLLGSEVVPEQEVEVNTTTTISRSPVNECRNESVMLAPGLGPGIKTYIGEEQLQMQIGELQGTIESLVKEKNKLILLLKTESRGTAAGK